MMIQNIKSNQSKDINNLNIENQRLSEISR
jgi:hypothetical protein